jgi:hypothetical protein
MRNADGQTPVLLAVNGANDYWYRANRALAPSLRTRSCSPAACWRTGRTVAAAVGDLERADVLKNPASSAAHLARIGPLSYAARGICTSSACLNARCLNTLKMPLRTRAFMKPAAEIIWRLRVVAQHGANPTPKWISTAA